MPEHLARIAGWIAGLIALTSCVFYLVAILRRQTTPNRASFVVWSVLGVVITASYYAGGARETTWVPLVLTISPIVVLILSIWYGEGGWEPHDRRCLLGAALGLVLWAVTGSPGLALVWTLLVDFYGAKPTIKKAWERPQSEDRVAWALNVAANVTNLFAVTRLDWRLLVVPLFWVVIGSTITVPLWLPRRRPELENLQCC